MKTNNKTHDGWPEGWLIAAAAAVMAAVLGRVIGDMGLMSTLLIGTFVFLVFGVLLGLLWGSAPTGGHTYAPRHGDTHDHAAQDNALAASAPPGPAAAFAQTPLAPEAPVMSAPTVATAMTDAPVMDTPAMAAPVAAPRVMDAPVMDAPAMAPPAMETHVRETPVTEPAALSQPVGLMADPEVVEPAGGPEPAAVAVQDMQAPDAMPQDGSKPLGLTAPRGGVADKLQTIEGIGPVLEKLCHGLGIYHFDQIAGWKAPEIAWMDGNLKGFKGRVTRDKWVRQAALIGEVGIEDFLRRAKTNDY